MNAMDFDDLLFRMVNVLELFPEVRQRYSAAFRHVLVDEYQDTNAAQYKLLQLIAGEHRNLAVVGDDAQCLIEGTRVTMADGSRRPIEDVRAGDLVLSSYGSGDLRAARVLRTHRHDDRADGIAITTAAGRRLVSTPEHVHFAGYRVGMSPELHTTYLQHKVGVGFRVGTSGTYVRGQHKPKMGFAQRVLHERADAAWVISTHGNEADARVAEAILAAKHGLPTLPFVARRTTSAKLRRRPPGEHRSRLRRGRHQPARHRAPRRRGPGLDAPAPSPAEPHGTASELDDHALRRPPWANPDAPHRDGRHR